MNGYKKQIFESKDIGKKPIFLLHFDDVMKSDLLVYSMHFSI